MDSLNFFTLFKVQVVQNTYSQCYGNYYDASDDPFSYYPRLTSNPHVISGVHA